MALWSNTDANTSAPKFVTAYVDVSQSSANVNLAYGNTTTSAFITNSAYGVFGVDTSEMANTSATNKASRPAHAGWVLRKTGMGKIDSIPAKISRAKVALYRASIPREIIAINTLCKRKKENI